MKKINSKENKKFVLSMFSVFRYVSKRRKIVLVIVLGLFFRLLLAKGSYNFDVAQFIQTGQVARTSLDIYANSQYYNYSPLWFLILGLLDRFYVVFPLASFSFIERAFISLIDIATFFLLYRIAMQRRLLSLKTAALFFLNPITIIISGHHGQFDNIAIFFLLLAVYFAGKNKIKNKMKGKIIWSLLTVGLIVKHIIAFQVLFFFVLFAKKKIVAISLFGLSIVVFLLTLLPFVPASGGQIINRVFLYGGVEGLYGMTYFLGNIFSGSIFAGPGLYQVYKIIFLIGYLLFVMLIRPKDIARGILLSILFFLTFTSGIGAQYFMLPIAFGVLFPTRWFYLYTLAVTLFFLGSVDELNIYTFKVFEWNTVWLFTIFWFISELAASIEPLNKLHRKLAIM